MRAALRPLERKTGWSSSGPVRCVDVVREHHQSATFSFSASYASVSSLVLACGSSAGWKRQAGDRARVIVTDRAFCSFGTAHERSCAVSLCKNAGESCCAAAPLSTTPGAGAMFMEDEGVGSETTLVFVVEMVASDGGDDGWRPADVRVPMGREGSAAIAAEGPFEMLRVGGRGLRGFWRSFGGGRAERLNCESASEGAPGATSRAHASIPATPLPIHALPVAATAAPSSLSLAAGASMSSW